MATLSPVNFTAGAVVAPSRSTRRTTTTPRSFTGFNTFSGLKAHNCVASLGVPLSTNQAFASYIWSLRKPSKKRAGGRALNIKCNAAGEIFRIAAIMNVLTLIGVAVGFVLLRIEAAVEESE